MPAPKHKPLPWEPPKGTDVSQWFTRRQVAELLGVSQPRVDSLQLPHILHDGEYRFNPEMVHGLVSEYERARKVRMQSHVGRRAARIFAAFDEGKTLRQIVVELRVTPEIVRDHYRQYLQSLEEGERERQERAERERQDRLQAQADREAQAVQRALDRVVRSTEKARAGLRRAPPPGAGAQARSSEGEGEGEGDHDDDEARGGRDGESEPY